MRAVLVDYLSKGVPLSKLIVQAGHRLVEKVENADMVFVDIDVPWAPDRVAMIEKAAEHEALVFQYPHGGNPLLVYDGLADPHPAVTAMLVTGPGHRQLQERFGHDRPVRDIGWFLCPTHPFRHTTEIRNVLFAPIHPWADGRTILQGDRDANIAAFEAVLTLDVPVTVRFIGDPEANGLWDAPNVTYLKSQPIPAIGDIERHDLIVSNGTFAALALARGKPVVMLGQDGVPTSDDGTETVATWESYRDTIRYPLDVADAPMPELASRALAGEGLDWAAQFIGEEATAQRLRDVLNEFTPARTVAHA